VFLDPVNRSSASWKVLDDAIEACATLVPAKVAASNNEGEARAGDGLNSGSSVRGW